MGTVATRGTGAREDAAVNFLRLLDPAKAILDYLGSFVSAARGWNLDVWSGAALVSPSAAPFSMMASSTGGVLSEAAVELAYSSLKEFILNALGQDRG